LAAGNTSAPNPEHLEPLESNGRSVGVPGAHREHDEALGSSDGTLERSGHGGDSTAALAAGVDEERE